MLRALIVDDDEIFARYVKKCIDWDGLHTQLLGHARNGAQAVEMVSELEPDIVIMDVEMPGMSGLESIERIRANSGRCQFILVTGHEKFKYAQSGARFGITDILLKPITRSSLDLALYRTVNEHWMDRLSQAAIRSVTDTSPAIDVLYLLEEDAPEQSVLGLCKKLLAKLLDGADEGVHDIVMQYAHCIENHGISQGRNIWLYIFPALVCMQRLLESERELAAPFDSKLNLLNYMRDGFLQGRAGAALFEVCRKTFQALKAPPKGRQTAAEIYDQLMRHYPEPNFNISELAKLMHFHEGYLRRIFKEAYGKAPNAALRDIRMSEAKKMIDAGELQIQQIARRVGFEDASYFSKCYKSYFGYPPSDRMGLGYTQGQK